MKTPEELVAHRNYMRQKRADPIYRAAEKQRARLRKIGSHVEVVGRLHPVDCSGACGCPSIPIYLPLRANVKRTARRRAILPSGRRTE